MSARGKPNQQAIMRLMADLREARDDPPEGTSASPVSEDNLLVWDASIVGPEDSPWEGGIYSMKIKFEENYPDKPPVDVRFSCPMFHPNIYSDGSICLDIITEHKWNPTYTICTLLASIQSLLTDPNPDSPANPEAARLLTSDKREYNRRVRRNAEASIGL
jgi:ubiquitin-conjugating enzyme E2 A